MAGFGRNVLALGSGSLVAQAISVLAVPVITRLYAPEQFGAFALVYGLVAVIFPIATLRLNAAILLPTDEQTAGELFTLSAISVCVVALVLVPALWWGLLVLAPVDDAVKDILWFLVAGVLLHGVVHAAEFWLLRRRRFVVMSVGAVTESVADRASAILLAPVVNGLAAGLVAGRLVGSGLRLAIMLADAARQGGMALVRGMSFASLRSTLWQYRKFPGLSTFAFLASSCSRELPTLVLASLFSSAVAGMYALGVRVLSFPMLLIGDAVAKVFFRHAMDLADRPERLRESAQLVVRCAIYLMVPPLMLLALAGPRLFEFVFGGAWGQAGRFAQVLALSYLATFLYKVLSIFFDIHDRQGTRLAFDVGHLALSMAAIFAGGMAWSVEGALAGLLLSTLAIHGAAFLYLLSLVGVSAVGAVHLGGSALVNLLPAIVAIVAMAEAGQLGPWAWVVGAAALGCQWPWLRSREPRIRQVLREGVA
jgi:O-antigen/teichoic acid export membrane protein